MTLLSYFSPDSIVEFFRRSNYCAEKNRNKYPVKIYRAVEALYDWVDCRCAEDCDCRKFGCRRHLVRKPDISFATCQKHFFECYVDYKAHGAVKNGREAGRGRNAVKATNHFEKIWQDIKSTSSKTLLCSEWYQPYCDIARSFKPGPETIYLAKWLSIISFDTYTAYDNASISLFKRDYPGSDNYLSMMEGIRLDIMAHLARTEMSIDEFRNYDNPNEFFPDIPVDAPRPIGNIIDKLYLTL
jgi:hypothetical protein